MNSSGRTISFDVLRIISAISIIIMHITSDRLYSLPIESTDWLLNAAVNSISHFGVPVFVMISGALFLNPAKETDIKRLYTHNILRLAIILLVWNSFYGIYDYLQYKADWRFIVWEITDGRNHLWFMPMIIGLYILTPVLHRWVKNATDKELKYFVTVFFVAQIICETLFTFEISEYVTFLSKYRDIALFCSYAGYFVIGYIVVHTDLFDKLKKPIYIAGAVSCVLNIPVMILYSRFKGTPMSAVNDSFSVLTFFYSLAVFCLMYNAIKDKAAKEKTSTILSNIGRDTLGLYLCHIAIIEIIRPIRDWYYSMPVLIGIPLYTLVIFCIGICISAILRRIPVIGRYIC